MTDHQWEILHKVIKGQVLRPLPIGFIIDSPWLPKWHGITILDYLTNDQLWLDANLKCLQEFPDILFLPGFWSEYGMCTEPSAFGVRCSFPPNEFPYPHKLLGDANAIENLTVPNPHTDGLLPFVLNRLKIAQPKIEQAGHRIRFSVSRGPLNVASYLLGTTEFLTLLMLDPEKTHILLKKITTFLKAWHELQKKTFPSIDGIFLLDDIIGFIGEDQFKEFALPYLKDIYAMDVSVKFLHNDASCIVSLPYLPEIGVNLFNMAFDTDLNNLKEITGNKVVMLGNIPPRDVLANGTMEELEKVTSQMCGSLKEKSRIIFSCGGGMPPDVTTEKINKFSQVIRSHSS
jgi:uroporphyrinogen-III decarboxylase